MSRVHARVVLLAGPSGTGKSRLTERTGLPAVRLDDFYKNGSDPTLPRVAAGATAGLVDWDHPGSWLPDDAVRTLETLCRTGRAEVPVYDLAHDGRCGTRAVALGGARLVVAEGIFAQEIVAACRARGLLAAALCLRQHPLVTFWRRLTRDLREHRKPPLVLLRRGLRLMRDQRRVVAHAVARGCEPVTPEQALARIRALSRASTGSGRASWVQPDATTCGSAALVRARMEHRPEYAEQAGGRFAEEALAMHRLTNGLRDRAGRRQLPWPLRLGTAPWSAAREMSVAGGSGRPGVRYQVALVRPWRRGRAFDGLARACRDGHRLPVYVGSRWCPRHVVLALATEPGDALAVYDPATGRSVTVDRGAWRRARLTFGGWRVPWFVILPRAERRAGPLTRRAGRRTPA